jgi:hydroxymethylpyrimidine/phosphomethylpyrimidine kinase
MPIDLTIKIKSDRNFFGSRLKKPMKKILLSAAGFDPTSGAGASLDLKVFHLLDFHGMSILTSITSQNTKYVNTVFCIPPELVMDQYKTLCEDVSLSGIKVGMVGCGENIQIIKHILSENPGIPRVVDPVFKSSSGTWLLEKDSIRNYISEIEGKSSLLTPNVEERLKKNVHGTGCFLSSSLLAYLAKGNTLEEACHQATQLTHNAIKNSVQIGRGQRII